MNSSTPPRPKLSPLEISTLALMGALIFGAKFALASLPNVNINAVLIILTTLFFGWRALYAVAILALKDAALRKKLEEFRKQQSEKVLNTVI